MGTFYEANAGSLQRSLDDSTGNAQADLQENVLLRRIKALEAELTELDGVRRSRDELEERVAQLREANENLVLAAVNAQTLRDDAEATNRRQNEFLAMLAHELRNPLAPISMAAALLARVPNASSQLLNLTQVIGRQVDHMAHLLDDLLDAARISSGKITLTIQPIRLSEVVAQAVETVQPRIKERRQQLSIDVPAEPIITDGDKVRLTQVFTNLLSNASKYTGDSGEITLTAAVEGDEVVVRVQDNGTGIAPEVLPHIFDLFTQGPRSLARSEGGLGVGLNVVRNLVLMHQGKVEAASDGIGKGSSFSVRLQLSREQLVEAPPATIPVGENACCKVLLIEDNVDACNTLQYFLATEGHEVSIAYDGPTGLAMASERPYDVIICDIGLPGLDGFDVIAELRKAPAGSKSFAIALSGYCQGEDRERALGAGFDHYFVKPISPDALLSMISSEECQKRRS